MVAALPIGTMRQVCPQLLPGAGKRSTDMQNHRMVWAGSDRKDHPVPTACRGQLSSALHRPDGV